MTDEMLKELNEIENESDFAEFKTKSLHETRSIRILLWIVIFISIVQLVFTILAFIWIKIIFSKVVLLG